MQLASSMDISDYDSFADAMNELNLWEFVDHQASVLAQERANLRNLYHAQFHPESKNKA